MNPPGSTAAAPSNPCIPCTTGHLEVVVWKFAVCWDTPEMEGLNAQDPRYEGVKVKVAGQEKTTDANGTARFQNLAPGTYSISVEKAGYEDITSQIPLDGRPELASVKLRSSAEVFEHKTSFADIVMRAIQYRYNANGTWSKGRECTRRHPIPTPGAPSFNMLAQILWSDEPSLLYSRDITWILFLVLTVAALAMGIADAVGQFPLYLSGLLAAIAAYLTGVIFGFGPGIAAIITASAGYVALGIGLIFAFFMRTGADVELDKGLIAVFFSMLTGTWTAFGFGYLGGRREEYSALPSWGFAPPHFLSAIIGLLAALVIFVVMMVAGGLGAGWLIAALLGVGLAGFFVYGGGGLAGWAFSNEGETQQFGRTDMQLPYLGERYTLQGARGYWSHFQRPNGPFNEGAYDFCLPDGTTVVSSFEGHVINYYEDHEYKRLFPLAAPGDDTHVEGGSTDYDHNTGGCNYVQVRHQDGSVGNYGWLMRNGVTGKQLNEPLKEAYGSGSSRMYATREGTSDPLFVRKGHQLGRAGYSDNNTKVDQQDWPTSPQWGWLAYGIGLGAALMTILLIVAFALWDGPPPDATGSRAFVGTSASDYCPPIVRNGQPVDLSMNNPEEMQKCADLREQFKGSPHGFRDDEGFDGAYCERMTFGVIEQHASTWSTLGFVALGIAWFAMFAAKGSNGKPHKNRMTSVTLYPVLLGSILIMNGPGSAFFHGSFLMDWAWLDSFGMDMFGAFVICYNLVRIFNWPWWAFLIIFLSLVILAFCGATGMFLPFAGIHIFAILVGGAFVTEIVLAFICHVTTDYDGLLWYWIGGMMGFGVAMLIWKLGHTGGPFCSPEGSLGNPDAAWSHAAWHFLGAFAMFCFSMYFWYQKDPEPCWPRLHFAVMEPPAEGPPVDQPEPSLQPGEVRNPHDRFLTVKFTDGSIALHMMQPRSMRKYLSGNTDLGLPPVEPAKFKPKGGGSHPVEAS